MGFFKYFTVLETFLVHAPRLDCFEAAVSLRLFYSKALKTNFAFTLYTAK